MIEGRTVLGIIPARGGSKGIPRKNIRTLASKPLLAWTVEAARKSKFIDRLIVSTDDDEIAEVARRLDCEVPFLRPADISGDTSGSSELVHHAIKLLGRYDLVVLLQPTSPLRKTADIDETISLCHNQKLHSATTIAPARENPSLMYFKMSDLQFRPILEGAPKTGRRQEQRQAYVLNGAVYVIQTETFIDSPQFVSEGTGFHLMPEERSVDIDTPLDFEYAEFLLNKTERPL